MADSVASSSEDVYQPAILIAGARYNNGMIHCRAATMRDIAQLHAVDDACVTDHQPRVLDDPAVVRFYLDHTGITAVLQNDRIVGFALSQLVAHMHGQSRVVWIEQISIHPDFRRRGLGKQLLGFIREQAGQPVVLHATIHPLNEPSLRLFKSCGASCSQRISAYW